LALSFGKGQLSVQSRACGFSGPGSGSLHQQSSSHPQLYAPRASCTFVKIARST
jgi:hypothetical protein